MLTVMLTGLSTLSGSDDIFHVITEGYQINKKLVTASMLV